MNAVMKLWFRYVLTTEVNPTGHTVRTNVSVQASSLATSLELARY